LKKTYTNNINEKIILEDKLGNKSEEINILITNIDKIAPKIDNVEEGKTYTESVKPIITEENLDSIELIKNGQKVEGYKKNDVITESGQYKLIVIDEAGNKTEITFTLDIQVEELEVELKQGSIYQIKQDEENLYIENVKPNTTIDTIIRNIETNGNIKVYKNNTEIIETTTKTGTGMLLKVSLNNQEKQYKIVVTGDLNGDAKMDDVDLLMLARYKAKLYRNLNGANLRASDIVRNEIYADDMDLLKMARILAKLDQI